MLGKYILWFKAHERLLIIALVLGAGIHGFNKWLDKTATDANAQAAVAKQEKIDAQVALKVALDKVDQTQSLFQAAQEAHDKEMASLVAAMASRDAASSNKVKAVSGVKTPPQAVADLSNAYPQLPQPIVPTDTGAQVPTEDLQQFTVTKIEVDTAKADLADTRTELKDSEYSLSQAVSLIGDKDKAIDALNVVMTKNNASCEAEKKQLTDDARKSKWRIFWMGVAAGFVGRTALIK